MPYILDFEASGLDLDDSYPIEVGWINTEDESDFGSYLICPAPHWTYWDKEAESIHKIKLETLVHEGLSRFEVADLIQEALQGQVVLSDAPTFEQMWLDRLSEDSLVDNQIKVQSVFGNIDFMKRGLFRKEVNRIGRAHRALDDVKALSQVYNQFLSLGYL